LLVAGLSLVLQPPVQQQQQPPQQEVPKWRVVSKPGEMLKGFDDEAYGEFFPEAAIGIGEDDDEPLVKGKGAAAGPEGEGGAEGGEAAGAGAAGGLSRRERRKAMQAGGGGGGIDESERKLSQKLNKQVQQMQGVFKEKGWGNEGAFRKEDKFDAVAATPARKRIRL
jgi:hypothetical protein